jgi:drug/metabolite transporter (DMT)-like permease
MIPRFDRPGDDNLRGSALMAAAMACFIVNDVCTKLVGARVPLGELILVRGVITTAIMGAAAAASGALFALPLVLTRPILARSAFDVAGTFLFLGSLLNLPLAELTAILQSAPLVTTLLAALLLGEPTGWRRWSAVAAGFLGVLIIVRPESGSFSGYTLTALGAVLCVCGRDLVTRRLPANVPSLIVSFANAAAVSAGGFGLALWSGFEPIALRDGLGVAGAALALTGGSFFLVVSVRLGELGATAPFRYTIIPWSILAGWLVWGETPSLSTLAGIALILGSGLYTLHREAGLRRQRSGAT